MTQVTLDFVRQCLPIRARDGHKGTFGKVHILAGSVGFTGAPALSASGAVRTGSGLVYLWVDRAIWPVLALKCQSAMPAPVPPFGTLLNKMNQSDGVLIGPGLGRNRKNDVRTLHLVQRVSAPMVLDADGLNAVSEHIDVLDTRPTDSSDTARWGILPADARKAHWSRPCRSSFGFCSSAWLCAGSEGASYHHRFSRW